MIMVCITVNERPTLILQTYEDQICRPYVQNWDKNPTVTFY
jgi:hypothetical protein